MEIWKNIETIKEDFLPLMGVAIDINDNKLIKELINKIPENKLTKHTNYYEFQLDNRYPTFFAYNQNILLITNDKKSIKSFKDGGYSSGNLGSSKNSSNIQNNNIFSFINLNFDEYPKNFKKKIQKNQTEKEIKMYKIWNKFAESIQFKKVDDKTVEIAFITKNKENNILNTIITTIDNNYKYFMSR